MHLKRALRAGAILLATVASAQSPTMKQLMVDLIYPASNDILLLTSRGGPQTDEEWAAARRSALALAESGNVLLARGRALDQGDWPRKVQLLVDAGSAAYQAVLAKDTKKLAAQADAIDRSCTNCHRQYRPNVFPRDGGSK